jgi:hypothetical protein
MQAVELKKLQAEGQACLVQFAHQLNALTEYEPPGDTKKGKSGAAPTLLQRAKDVCDRNIFLRFTLWFILILLLTSSAVLLFNWKLKEKLRPDTMATLVIGTSVASAAVLAVYRGKKEPPDKS